MRKTIIAGNWKLNKTVSEAVELAKAVAAGVKDNETAEVVIAPVYTALYPVSQALKGAKVKLASQDCSRHISGAFTGEVGPTFLKDAGVDYVILGHSERRHLFGERFEEVGRKAKIALEYGLKPIVCIGETLEERESEETLSVVLGQLAAALLFIKPTHIENGDVVVAYEPVWAIGTGKTATPETAEEVHAEIRAFLKSAYGEKAAENTSILYGGSVKPGNVAELTAMKNIDGGLIGGASLKAEDFLGILNNASK